MKGSAWVQKFPGGTVVWVGNRGIHRFGYRGGNLRAIYRALGGTGPAPDKYGDLYKVVVPDRGTVRVERSYFGEKPSAQ